jgi:two-component system sensor histidine kinase KdpD
VQVRETLPDWVLQEAFELVLIDLPPRELLERLREGKVYVPEQARAAIDAPFPDQPHRPARTGDADRRRPGGCGPGQRLPPARPGSAGLRGRLLVGVDGDDQAERLVRHASRVAQRRHLPWSLVHVDNGRLRDETARHRLQAAQQLAERLGGKWCCSGPGGGPHLIQHAAERRASLVLVGQSRDLLRRRCSVPAWRRGCCAKATAWKSTCSTATPSHNRPALRPSAWVWRHYLLALLATVLARRPGLGGVQCWRCPTSRWCSSPPCCWWRCAAASARRWPAPRCRSCLRLLFIPPNFSFSIQREEDVLTLVFFLLMAALTGNLAARQRRQLQALRETQAQTSQLLDLSRRLTVATDRQAVFSAAGQHLNGWGHAGVPARTQRRRPAASRQRRSAAFTDNRTRRRRWAWQHGQAAGFGSDTCPMAAGGGGRWRWRSNPGAARRAPAQRRAMGAQRRRLLMALAQPWPRPWPAPAWRATGSRRACTAKPSNCAAPCWPRCPTTCAPADVHARQHRQPAGAGRSHPRTTAASCSKAPAMKPSAWTATSRTCWT